MQYKVKFFLNKYLYQRKLIVLSKTEISWDFLTTSAFHKKTLYYRSIYYARILLLNPIFNGIQLMFCLGVMVSYQPIVTYNYLSHPVNYCCCLGVFCNNDTILGLFQCFEVSPVLQLIRSDISWRDILIFLDTKSNLYFLSRCFLESQLLMGCKIFHHRP